MKPLITLGEMEAAINAVEPPTHMWRTGVNGQPPRLLALIDSMGQLPDAVTRTESCGWDAYFYAKDQKLRFVTIAVDDDGAAIAFSDRAKGINEAFDIEGDVVPEEMVRKAKEFLA